MTFQDLLAKLRHFLWLSSKLRLLKKRLTLIPHLNKVEKFHLLQAQLILSPSKFKLWARKFCSKIWGSIPSGPPNFFAIFFSLPFFSLKEWILKHKIAFLYINWLQRNEIEFVQHTFMENMKMKRKKDKKIEPSPTGIWTLDFWANSQPWFEFWGNLIELAEVKISQLYLRSWEGTNFCCQFFAKNIDFIFRNKITNHHNLIVVVRYFELPPSSLWVQIPVFQLHKYCCAIYDWYQRFKFCPFKKP